MSDAERNLGLLTAVMKLLHGWRAEGDAATADDLAWLASLRGVEIPDEVLLAVLWDRVRLYDVKMHEAFEVIAEARRLIEESEGRRRAGTAEATRKRQERSRRWIARAAELKAQGLSTAQISIRLSDERDRATDSRVVGRWLKESKVPTPPRPVRPHHEVSE